MFLDENITPNKFRLVLTHAMGESRYYIASDQKQDLRAGDLNQPPLLTSLSEKQSASAGGKKGP